MPNVDVETVSGQQKSEFAIHVNEEQKFSRLEERRFPELEDLVEICQAKAS